MSIENIQEKVLPIMKKYHIKDAYIFGSFARKEDRPDSDIDLLVSFKENMGMFKYMQFINNLEEVLGHKVDVVTEKSLSPYIKPYIEKDLEKIYEEE